jgi:integrase
MVWRADQLGAFLDAAEDDHLYALWHLVAHRGLRRGEACGLEWDDVALSSGLVTILRQRICVGGDIIEDDPKSEAGGRVIALDAGTIDAPKAHRKRQMQDRLRCGAGWVESGKVFTRDNGEALDPNTVSDRLERLILEADLPPIRLHDLRHGAASLMLAAGVDMKVVQETLGHSSLVLTANTYTYTYTSVYPRCPPQPRKQPPHSYRAERVNSMITDA